MFVFLKLALDDFFAIEVRQIVNHRGAGLTVALHDWFEEIGKVESIVFIKFDDHTDIYDVELDFISASASQISESSFLGAAGLIEGLQGLVLEEKLHDPLLYGIVFLFEVSFDFTEKWSRVFSDFDQNITTVTVSMDKIVFHQHFEESHCT